MSNQRYIFDETGRLLVETTNTAEVTNAEAILKQAFGIAEKKEPKKDRIFYNVGGFGQTVVEKYVNGRRITYVAIPITHLSLNLQTGWCLQKAGNNVQYLRPWTHDDPTNEQVNIGAPMILDVPEDLLMCFIIKFVTPIAEPALIDPKVNEINRVTQLLWDGIGKAYVGCFSASRNTCVDMPLPNLYSDGSLCTGSSFDVLRAKKFDRASLMEAARGYCKGWLNSGWNLDLMDQFNGKPGMWRDFARFHVETGKTLTFKGCEKWPRAAPNFPAADIFAPFMDVKVKPVEVPSEN